MTKVLLSADDRTGSLEIGGLIANESYSVPVGPNATSDQCCVVDIATRHLSATEAQERMSAVLARDATHRAHKMDAGLRGNWPHEVEVLLKEGHKVAIVCAFPDAGRRCDNGIVYIHDLPVLDSVFGTDPLNPQVSSKPAEVLEHFGVSGDVVVWDANTNEEMDAAVARAVAEDRIVVGASGAIGAYAKLFLPQGAPRQVALPRPLVVLCGSLNELSRDQIAKIGEPVQHVVGKIAIDPVTVIATNRVSGPLSDDQAVAMANLCADVISARWSEFRALLVIGGDTAGAIVGDETMETIGCVAPGIPVSWFREKLVVTKGGGIGQPETVAEIVSRTV